MTIKYNFCILFFNFSFSWFTNFLFFKIFGTRFLLFEDYYKYLYMHSFRICHFFLSIQLLFVFNYYSVFFRLLFLCFGHFCNFSVFGPWYNKKKLVNPPLFIKISSFYQAQSQLNSISTQINHISNSLSDSVAPTGGGAIRYQGRSHLWSHVAI